MTAPPTQNPTTSQPHASPADDLSQQSILHLPAGVISQVPVLSVLEPQQLATLLVTAEKRRYVKGDWILRQGGHNQHLHVMLSGRAHAMRIDERGRDVIVGLLRPGDHFGEMGLIDNQPCSRTVRCAATSDVLSIDGSALARVLPHRPELSDTLLRGLVSQLRQAHRQITSLALHDVEGRLARLLFDLSTPGLHEQRILSERLSRQELARMVGASREMVSRIMASFEERGLLVAQPDGSYLLAGLVS